MFNTKNLNTNHEKILKYFNIYAVCNEEQLADIKQHANNKQKLKEYLMNLLYLRRDDIEQVTRLELFMLLTNFCLKYSLENIEICTLFSIFWDIVRMCFRKNSKEDIYNYFKEKIIKHSMDRPPYQIGIFKKQTLEYISEFFIETIYKKYELLKYLLTKKNDMELYNTELFTLSFPHTLPIDLATEIVPRHCKILKQYYEGKKAKTELEQKIDMIIEFERDNVDKIVDSKFKEQDEFFNKKLEELTSKKKK